MFVLAGRRRWFSMLAAAIVLAGSGTAADAAAPWWDLGQRGGGGPGRLAAGGTGAAGRAGADPGGTAPAPVSLRSAAVDVAGCPRTLWRDSSTPAVLATTETSALELGVKFRADRDGYVTGVRFYKGAGNSGTHIGRLWSNRGEKLAEATFTGETGSGWQRVDFGLPVRVAAGTTYVASYYAPVGRYSYSTSYFASAPWVRPPLTGLRNGTDGGNGVFKYGAGFPSSTYQSSNYWVDVVFDPTADQTCPDTIWTDTQVPGAATTSSSSVELGVKFRADRDGYVQGVRFYKGPGNTGTHVGRLWSVGGQKLAEATFLAESPTGWQEAWFGQPVALSAGTTYVASYLAPVGHYAFGEYAFASSGVTRGPLTALRDGVDGGNGVFVYGSGGFPTATYHSSNYLVDVVFTTQSALACPCTVWPATGEPSQQASPESSALELGVKFRAQRTGYVKGVRFYKGPGNTGTHIGRLWSTGGTTLAQATFGNESAGGWQQVLFSSPVAVQAGTTYTASYYAPAGHYAYDESYFAVENTASGPLAALAEGVSGGNGVFRYGAGFPSSTYHSTNYWVDVVYEATAADITPPVLVAQLPAPDSAGVAVASVVTARFSEAVQANSIAFDVRTADGTQVPGATGYDATTRTAMFTPSAQLGYRTDHQVTVSGARDGAGNVMEPASWSFSTAVNPAAGPGGPIGVITSTADPYGTYYAEILRAEGMNEFSVLSLDALTATDLAGLDVAILADVALTDERASLLNTWVNDGGHLIAMSPDQRLAGLLGITATGATLSNAYLAVDPATPPGAGITTATMQFHGTADRYTLAGAAMVARLYSDATTSTPHPAVTVRSVGSAGGRAAAFSYDLARSVALTRQGNPAWAGQDRDGLAPIRSNDMFFGGSSPDWVDLSKVGIPQADEQQRLLVNLIEYVTADRKPLPRFWYLPSGANATVVATGDDEEPGTTGTQGRFDRYLANSPAGCSPADWQCLRFTSYVWPSVGLTDAQARAYYQQGFEVGLHPQNGCTNFTAASLEQTYATQLPEWGAKYASLPAPATSRYHCVVFSDWDSQPNTEVRHGIRLDANYYYYPGSWIQDRPGFMTGSGFPMRFTDTTGATIDVYQAPTQMTDESQQSYPYTPNTLLDRALGADGYYGVFLANMHDSNKPTSYEDDQLVASAQNHGVPVVTARAMLDWLNGRDASSFDDLSWSSGTLGFTITAGRTARGLTAMLPTSGVGGSTLTGISRSGSGVAFGRITIKGVEYAFFPAVAGTYTATYGAGIASVTAASVALSVAAPAASGTGASASAAPGAAAGATVSWASGLPGTAEVAYGTSPAALSRTVVAERSRAHRVALTGLAAGTTYYYRVTSTDGRGRALTWPDPGQLASFTTAPADTRPPAISGLRVTPLPDSTVRVSWQTDEPSTSSVVYGEAADRLDHSAQDATPLTSHLVVLANLDAQRPFHLRVSSTDAAGNTEPFPPSGTAPARFVTAPAGVADQTRVGLRTGTASGAAVVRGSGLAELTLTGPSGPTGTPATGGFQSRVLDAFRSVGWQTAVWEADTPAGARLTVSVRTGDTAKPDASWSPWTPVAGPNAALGVAAGRFLQYRVALAAGRDSVPVLRWIGFTYDGALPGAERRAGRTVG